MHWRLPVGLVKADLLALMQHHLRSHALSSSLPLLCTEDCLKMICVVQAEVAAVKADLLALRQHHLRSRALSTAGSDFAGSDEDDAAREEEEELLSERSFAPRSRRSRYETALDGH